MKSLLSRQLYFVCYVVLEKQIYILNQNENIAYKNEVIRQIVVDKMDGDRTLFDFITPPPG